MPIREAFEKAEGQCCVATWMTGSSQEKYELISAGDFAPEDLPVKGALVETEEDEHIDYIERINKNVEYDAARIT